MDGALHVDADQIAELVPKARAVAAVRAALRTVPRIDAGAPRQIINLAHGQFLLMPSEAGSYAGVKVATVAPANPDRGLPRIQATYLLFDSDTLRLVATMDGIALTNLRTPAVSIAAIHDLLPAGTDPLSVVCFGHGPQGRAHVETLRSVACGRDIRTTWVARDLDRATDALDREAHVVAANSDQMTEAVANADVIFCATSARTPLFPGEFPKASAVIVAVGSHEPDVRELDAILMGRSHVIVEDVATALREGGDVIIAIAEGTLEPDDLHNVTDVATGRTRLPRDRPVVFKSSGMAWQDLVVATEVYRTHQDLTRS